VAETGSKRIETDLSGQSKQRLLAQLAFTMMKQRISDLDRDQLLSTIRPGIKRLSTSVDAEGFVANVESNGLLVEREKGIYAFAHLTFQEYLAAQHIRANGLGDILAQATDDVWWRETTLLYTADADADLIVRACLKSGSVAALSLGFECSDLGGELAPDLRLRLTNTLTTAFKADVAREGRLLVAGVLASRYLREAMSTSSGSYVCPRPVPANLYSLFLSDTRVPSPDVPCPSDLSATYPVTGLWGREATRFIAWINAIGPVMYRLPTRSELEDLATKAGSGSHFLSSSANSAWTQSATHPAVSLWTSPGNPSPHTVLDLDILEAVTNDAKRLPVLSQLTFLGIHFLVRRLVSTRDLDLDRDLALDRALTLAFSLDIQLARALGLERALSSALTLGLARTRGLALDDEIASELGLVRTKESSVKSAGRTSHQLWRLHRTALSLQLDAPGIDLDLDLDRMRSLALGPVFAQKLGLELDIARELGVNLDVNPDLARDFGHFLEIATAHAPSGNGYWNGNRNKGNEAASQLDVVMGRGLAGAIAATVDYDGKRSAGQLAATFARALMGDANNSQILVAIDDLPDRLHRASNAITKRSRSDSWRAAVSQRILELADPILKRHARITPTTAAYIRLSSLALAHEAKSDHEEHADAFRTLAACATLLEKRVHQRGMQEVLMVARL
jgi:hypothetical protein